MTKSDSDMSDRLAGFAQKKDVAYDCLSKPFPSHAFQKAVVK